MDLKVHLSPLLGKKMKTNVILNGGALTHLKTFPSECVDMCMTSPPYWSHRNYEVNGQIGLEPTFEKYIKKLCDIFDEVKRVLKKQGTCWVVIGDTFIGSGPSRHIGYSDPKKPKVGEGNYEEPSAMKQSLSPKCLAQIPSRFAIEMCKRGWILRSEIVWRKPNAMPESCTNRFTVDFEKIFMFSKLQKYYFEQQFEKPLTKEKRPYGIIRQRIYNYKGKFSNFGKKAESFSSPRARTQRTKYKEGERAGLQRQPTLREKRVNEIIQLNIANYIKKYLTKEKKKILNETFREHKWTHWIRTDESGASLPSPSDWTQLKEILGFDDKYDDIMTEIEVYLDDGMMWKNKGKNKRAVWDINTNPSNLPHLAIYPEELCEIPIRAGCPEGGVILDPFFGSGTSGVVALKQGKKFIGIELNGNYCKIAEKRLKPWLEQQKLTQFRQEG